VQRELREGARRPFNYWLRVAGATAGALLLYVVHQSASGNQAAQGLQLFTSLHLLLLALILVMVPAMSADCIAREKREDTLGLLFLTPLTAMGIVAARAHQKGKIRSATRPAAMKVIQKTLRCMRLV